MKSRREARSLSRKAMSIAHHKRECRGPRKAPTRVGNVALGVAEGPDDGVNDELELRGAHRQQRREAGAGDRAQQRKELQALLRVVLQRGRQQGRLTA